MSSGGDGLWLVLLVWFRSAGQAVEEGLQGGAAEHAAALMRPLAVVAQEEGVEGGLHLGDRLVPDGAALHAQVFVEQGAVQALDDAVALRSTDLGGLVGDALELEEQLVGMLILAAAELAAIVAEHGVDPRTVLLEGRQDLVVQGLDRGDRHLVGEQLRPGIAGMAVDHGLQVDLADALEHADEERVDRHQGAGVGGLDMALAELGAEALQEPRLLRRELDRLLGAGLFQAQQPLVLGEQIVAAPDTTDATQLT